MLTHLDFG